MSCVCGQKIIILCRYVTFHCHFTLTCCLPLTCHLALTCLVMLQGHYCVICLQEGQQRRASWHTSRAPAGRAQEGHAVITKQTQHTVCDCTQATARAGHDATCPATSHTCPIWICSRGCSTPSPSRGCSATSTTSHGKWLCPTPTCPLCASTTICSSSSSTTRYALLYNRLCGNYLPHFWHIEQSGQAFPQHVLMCAETCIARQLRTYSTSCHKCRINFEYTWRVPYRKRLAHL